MSRFVTPNGNRFGPLMLIPGRDPKDPQRTVGKRFQYKVANPMSPARPPVSGSVVVAMAKKPNQSDVKKGKDRDPDMEPASEEKKSAPVEKKKPTAKRHYQASGRTVRDHPDAQEAGHSGHRVNTLETKKLTELKKRHLTISWQIGSLRSNLRRTFGDQEAANNIETKILAAIEGLNNLKAMAMGLVNMWIKHVHEQANKVPVPQDDAFSMVAFILEAQ